VGSSNQQVSSPLNSCNRTWVRGLSLLILVFVGYYPTWRELVRTWATNPQSSHGFLVLPFAAYLLWHRRALLPTGSLEPSWWAIPLLALAAAMRLVGARYYVGTLEQYSLLPAFAGITLAGVGWAGLRWAWPSIAFLFFMFPLHGRLSGLLTGPLQRIGTLASTFLIQTVGIPAVATGNVIHLTEVDVGVIDACSGLRMMMTFFALTTAVAVIVDRPRWQKVLIGVSAIPIALVCNIGRITVTSILHETVGHELAERVFHDLAGWLMMPAALAILWVGLRVLDRVFVPIPSEDEISQNLAMRETAATTTIALPSQLKGASLPALQPTGK
jgi:exosortase